MVQIIIEDTKTSIAPHIPCLIGWSVWLVAWAMGAVPRPASFEKIPLASPHLIEIKIPEPAAPLAKDFGLKAQIIISFKAGIKFSIWKIRIKMQPII